MRLLRRVLLGVLLLVLLWPALAAAQGTQDWRELPTNHFIILFTPGSETVAEEYAQFADTIYEEVSTIFSHNTRTPLTLRLYPTLESYHEVNPLARNVPGVVAHADFRRRELVVVLSQAEALSPAGVQNNIRHELTHIVASDLSGNRLNVGFQEGIAQYVEHPSPELDRKIQLLRFAREQGRLLPWSDFDNRDKIYGNPEVGYPQTLSVVAFLVEQYGFSTFREFLTISAQSSGYRSALERAYGLAPGDLEEQWRDWLPAYLDGDYRRSALTSYDLEYPKQLLEEGNYAAAQEELEQTIERLEVSMNQAAEADVQRVESLAAAKELLARSLQGQEAERLATEAWAALEAGDYATAGQLVNEARTIYAALGDTRQDEVLAVYAERAERGLHADEQLSRASSLARTLRFAQARMIAETAATEFAALGDRAQFERALSLRQSLNTYQRMVGMALLIVGALGLGVSLFGRWYYHEREVW